MRYLLLFLCLTTFRYQLPACTTFFINQNGQMVFGRNYDWITDAGRINTNARGVSKTSMKTEDGETISWVSQYGSITFNQYGKEFPTGGMNEKGLVVELMWLDETKYPKADARPAIGVLQWIQYQLDNCSSIQEVIATDKKIRIASVGTTPLHYLVADAGGRVATIEFLDGKMVVHTGKDLADPVLTNTSYDESTKRYGQSNGANNSFAYGNNSLERFGTACSMIREYKTKNKDVAPVDYAFNILSAVSQGSATKWSIVYDIGNKAIHFRTHRFQQIKIVKFDSFDFNCSKQTKSWDMNQAGNADISSRFEDYTINSNRELVEKAFNESKSQINVPDRAKTAVAEYPSLTSCK